MNAPDRLELLAAQNQLTGIDFVFVHPDQVRLDVYFHLPIPSSLANPLTSGGGVLVKENIRIYNALDDNKANDVPVTNLSWNGEILQLTTAYPGDFSLYKIRIEDPNNRIDRYFNDIGFSFKVNCPTDLDCAPIDPECPPEKKVDFPVDYQARDFWSYRKALLDFASLRYPDWKSGQIPDAGVMMAEVMSALGDEMAYYQDRIGREAHFETASQRRSLRNHAKLIDYPLHDGMGATTWIDVTVEAGKSTNIDAGTSIWAKSDTGQQFFYEVGNGLKENIAGKQYAVNALLNTLIPHCWDEDDTCLPIGATEIYIDGHYAANITLDDNDGEYEQPGKWILLKTNPNPSLPERAHLVRVIKVTNKRDPIFNKNITHLVWEEEQATPYELDMVVLELKGNLLPVTSGKTEEELFVVGKDPEDLILPLQAQQALDRAIEREGGENSVIYRFTLSQSDESTLTRLGDQVGKTIPEVQLNEVSWQGGKWENIAGNNWSYRPSFIGVYTSQALSTDYTLEDGTWKRVVGYQRNGTEFIHKDYAKNEGLTLRFGDGAFGKVPAKGTIFKVSYRLGSGRRSNVPIHTLNHFSTIPFIESITNPLPASNGRNAESPNEVRQLASEAYKAVTYRAVRPEDYAEAVERLPGIQKAGAAFRWTGSWLSAFVTPDPKGTVILNEHQKDLALNQLDRFRQAGRETHLQRPKYADIDLIITVCVAPNAYKGEVKLKVLEALFGKKGNRPKMGYFAADRFTFGTPIERSTLEETIQSVPGVRAVEDIYLRRRGWFNWRLFRNLVYEVGMDRIIRIENNPLHPEMGIVQLKMEGGA